MVWIWNFLKYLLIDLPISKVFPEFAQFGKESITVKHLLVHNSGLPAVPPVIFLSKAFGCPEALKPKPQLAFTCQEKIFDAVMAQKLANPIGAKMVYSDLSMITLNYVVGHYAKKLGYVKESDVVKECLQPTKRG